MKKLLVILTFLLAGCGGDKTSLTEATVTLWAQEERTGGIAFIGDSITYLWPEDQLPEGAYNRGIPYNTTFNVIDRLWLVNKEQPDEIYLMIGINNLHEGLAAGGIATHIGYIIGQFPAAKIHVMGLLPSKLVPVETVIEVNRQIQEALTPTPDVEYFDMFDLFYDGEIIHMTDGIHPDEEGYSLMYDFMFGGDL